MPLFGTLTNFLKGPVGNNLSNDPEDVRIAKKNMKDLGYFNDEVENDFITRTLDKSIKDFQKDFGLKIDGVMRPAGETERTVFEVLTDRPSEELFGPDPMKQTGLGIGFGTGISTLDQLQEAAKKSGGHVFTYIDQSKRKSKSKPNLPPHALSLNAQTQLASSSGGSNSSTQSSNSSNVSQNNVSQRTGDPTGYNKREYLDKVERYYEDLVEQGRKSGLKDASDNLEHFLDGTGKEQKLTREEARDKLFIRNGEEANRKRFTQGFTDKKKIGSELLKLKNGQTINVTDNWDYRVGALPIKSILKNGDPSRSHLLRGDIDEYLATGESFVQSDGNFQATRQGNTVSIEGVVTHKWEDVYDFDPMQSGGAGAATLESGGRAKSFDITSSWKQKVTGTVQIKNGKLVNPQLRWEDINPKKTK